MELLQLAQSIDSDTIFIVGTGRNVGKTTVVRAIYAAAIDAALRTGIESLNPKHRLWLQRDTLFVTARAFLARAPACEIVKLSRVQSPAGALLYARTAAPAYYELVGPSTASGVRETVDELSSRSEMVIVDGAVDRVAAVAGSDGAVVVACGAATANGLPETIDEAAALIARLRVPAFDDSAPAIAIDGALTAQRAAALIAARESRQIVVRDPTQVALAGKAAVRALSELDIRCRRPLRVIAVTIASIAPERSFEPRTFMRRVAAATDLPVFDLYAGARAA